MIQATCKRRKAKRRSMMSERTFVDNVREALEAGCEEWIGYAPFRMTLEEQSTVWLPVIFNDEMIAQALEEASVPFESVECEHPYYDEEIPEEWRVAGAEFYCKVVVRLK